MPRSRPHAHLTRRSATAAAAAATVTALLAAGATPAAAQTAAAQDVAGGAAASALVLTLNLPGGAATRVVLELDPVTGTVSRTSSSTTADAEATVLRGSLGGQALDSGTSAAQLPSPLTSTSNPSGALADALAGTPLADLLRVDLLPSGATVSASPSSTSEAAVAGLGAGLPDALASALAPLTTPLQGAVGDVLTALATASGTPVAQICAGVTGAVTALDPVTSTVDELLGALPVPIPVTGLLDTTTLGALCGLSTTLAQLNTALQGALSSLTGDSGVLGTGLVTSTQSITRTGTTTTARAEASVASLTLLGQSPFATAGVLRTASTASAAGTPGSAQATVDSTVADVTGGTVDPFLQVRATLAGIVDSFVGEGDLPPELATLLEGLISTVNAALAPVGVTVLALDDSVDSTDLAACPTSLDGLQSGTFEAADGRCAAAATRGVGVSVTLPAALAGPLQIAGPLVELQVVPSSAVAQARPAALVTPPTGVPPVETPPTDLPRTGLDSALLGGTGALLLLGAAAVRRRRSALPA